ncbi:hypothetical protein TNCV_3994551 [Trichonephila clavipes]|nr:hypothetical protein TNCV_3994551 [Trichonephila clavipes]
MEAKHVKQFRSDDVLWEKISKGLLRNPDRPLKNTDKRMVYIYNNMFFVKKGFTFGFRTKNETVRSKVYKLPPPTRLMYVQRQTNYLWNNIQGLPPKRNRVFITPVIRPPVAAVLIARPSTALATPQPIPDLPVQIPVFQPPVQISPVPTTPPVQIPDPPPELTTPLVQIPDPPVQIPPVPTTPPVQLFYQIHHLCRSFYQILHLWSRLWSRPLWTTLQ